MKCFRPSLPLVSCLPCLSNTMYNPAVLSTVSSIILVLTSRCIQGGEFPIYVDVLTDYYFSFGVGIFQHHTNHVDRPAFVTQWPLVPYERNIAVSVISGPGPGLNVSSRRHRYRTCRIVSFSFGQCSPDSVSFW